MVYSILIDSSCRVFSWKTNCLWPKTNIEMDYTKEKAAGDPLEPLQSMLICRGPFLLRSRIEAFIFRCLSDRHLNIDRRGCRGFSVVTSSVFRFILSLQIQSPIGISLFTHWYICQIYVQSLVLGWEPMFSNGHPWVGIQYTHYEDSIAHFAGVRPWHQF